MRYFLLGDLLMDAKPPCSRVTALLVTFLTLVALAGVTAEVRCHACCDICTLTCYNTKHTFVMNWHTRNECFNFSQVKLNMN